MSHDARSSAAQVSETSSQSKVVRNPATGELMAPGSKVWPYFVDHTTWGRQWIGPKSEYNFHMNQLLIALPGSANKLAEGRTLSSSAASSVRPPPTMATQRQTKKPNMAPPTPAKKKAQDTPLNFKTSRQVDIDKWYDESLERKTKLRQAGNLSESNLMQAAINAGVMLGWNKRDVLSVVHRWIERSSDENRAAVKQAKVSQKMIEVAAEVQHVEFKGEWKELQELTKLYKGKSHGNKDPISKYGVENCKAPGMLMLIQSSVSVAFWKCLDSAVEENEEFDEDTFGFKAALYFRVPLKACGDERVYLLQMSRLGTKESAIKKFAACPGIERPLLRQEKATILEASKVHVPQSKYVIEMLTKIFDNLEEVHDNGNAVRQGSVTRAAMERMSDEGFLVLDYIYRKGVGFPILVGDEIVDGEEEEEEDSDGEIGEDETQDKDTEMVNDSADGIDAMHVNTERPSLIVRLRYSRQVSARIAAILRRQPAATRLS